jgi:hypothetical protein
MTRRLLPLLALLLVLAGPSAAHAAPVDVPQALGDELIRVAGQTDVPIRLPATIDLGWDGEVHPFGDGRRRSYSFDLAAVPDCGGANACFLAQFSGERGGTPAFRRRATLVRGIRGYYKPVTCGASCSPAMIQWRQGGVLYSIQAKLDASGTAARRALVRAANSAIRSTPR